MSVQILAALTVPEAFGAIFIVFPLMEQPGAGKSFVSEMRNRRTYPAVPALLYLRTSEERQRKSPLRLTTSTSCASKWCATASAVEPTYNEYRI